jgi:hypothetical protein
MKSQYRVAVDAIPKSKPPSDLARRLGVIESVCGTYIQELFMSSDGFDREDQANGKPPHREELKEGEDYYYEGPYMVFTEQYHLKRGSCCNSGCRHCPYKSAPKRG